MINLLLDARKLGDGGIGVYIENLVDGLIELRSLGQADLHISLLISPTNRGSLEDNFSGKLVAGGSERFLPKKHSFPFTRWVGEIEVVLEPSRKYSLSEYFFLASHQKKTLTDAHLFHSPHYTLPFFLPVPSIVTIHDVIHITHPDTVFHRPIGRRLIQSALSRANHVITVSRASAAGLHNSFPGTTTSITVVPNAFRKGLERRPVQEVNEFIRDQNIRKPYALFVGSERPHKGFRELLFAWRKLLSRLSTDLPVVDTQESSSQDNGTLELIFVGEHFSKDSRRLVAELSLEGSVRFFGEATVSMLSCLYSGARFVVIPSREEGFGLVALEALFCEVPLVCTPVPSLLEVCGKYAWFSETFSSDDLYQAMLCLLTQPREAREKVIFGRKRAENFNRPHVALETFRIYQRVLGQEGEKVKVIGQERFPRHENRIQKLAAGEN